MTKSLRAALAIAAQDLRDVTRQRSTWILLILLPFVNVMLIVALPGVLSQREREQRTRETFTVAVDGTPSDVSTLGALLEPALLRVVTSSDPAGAVKGKRAHIGIVLPEGSAVPGPPVPAGTVADASEVQVRLFALGTRATSRLALGRAVATLEAYRSQLTEEGVKARGLSPRVARPIAVEAVDLADTDLGGRLALSALAPLLLLFPLTSALNLAGQRVSGGKDQRVIEPLLLLPVSRSLILLGKAVSGYVIGLVMLPAIVVPLVLGRILPVGEAGREVVLSPSTVLAVLAIAVVVLAFFVAMGACAGAASRTTAELGALAPFLTVPIMLFAISINFLQVRTVPSLAAIPLFGPTLAARDVVAGTADAINVVIALLTTGLCAVVLVVVSGRLLERERSVLRPTS